MSVEGIGGGASVDDAACDNGGPEKGDAIDQGNGPLPKPLPKPLPNPLPMPLPKIIPGAL